MTERQSAEDHVRELFGYYYGNRRFEDRRVRRGLETDLRKVYPPASREQDLVEIHRRLQPEPEPEPEPVRYFSLAAFAAVWCCAFAALAAGWVVAGWLLP